MRHVDEGTLHAWLDGEVTDPAEAASIDEHLQTCAECGARLAEAQKTIAQAEALLASVAPAAERPSFEALVARSGSPSPDTRIPGLARRFVLPVSWAASVLLAAAIGWAIRHPAAAPRDAGEVTTIARGPEHAESREAPSVPAVPETAPTQEKTRVAVPLPAGPASGAAAARAASDAPPVQTRTAEAASEAKAVASEPRRSDAAANQGTGAQAAEPPAGVAGSVSPPVDALTINSSAAAPRALEASAPPAAPPAAVSGTTAPALPPAAPLPQLFAPRGEAAPAAAPRAGGGAGRGGGGRGVAGGLRPDGQVAQSRAAQSVSGVEWRTVPRTEAAARSGMPLYGIEGLAPVATMVNTADTAVRTMYRLPTGETVEVVQQKVPPAAVASSLQGRVLLDGGSAAADGLAQPPATWTTLRGDVRVDVRGVSDAAQLAALGARLRLD